MAGKRSTSKPRKKAGPGRRRSGPILVDPDLRIPAQAVLTTTRRIKRTLADAADPAERRRLRRLLNRVYRKVRAYRQALEALALVVPQLAGPQLEEQIQIFMLVEDEFTSDVRASGN